MEKHKKHSIVWKVESSEVGSMQKLVTKLFQNEGELPIIEVQIEYIRKSILHERVSHEILHFPILILGY